MTPRTPTLPPRTPNRMGESRIRSSPPGAYSQDHTGEYGKIMSALMMRTSRLCLRRRSRLAYHQQYAPFLSPLRLAYIRSMQMAY